MKCLYLSIIAILFISNITNSYSQSDSTTKIKTDTVKKDTSWKYGGNIGFNVSQTGLSNWTGGGKNALNIAALTSLFLNFIDSTHSWTNYLELGYGLTQLGTDPLRKSDDRLNFTSKFGHNVNKYFSYSALLDFRTQFYKGFNYDKIDSFGKPLYTSNFLAPAYLNLGIGFNYKPESYIEVYLSPISNRLIIVTDTTLSNEGAFGVDKGKKIKSELGTNFNVLFNKEIMHNISLKTRLNVFSPFSNVSTMVVNSETLINMKVNASVTVSFALDMIYDDKVLIQRTDGTKGPAMQTRNVLALGIGYKF